MLEKIKAIILAVLAVTGGVTAQLSGIPCQERNRYANVCRHLQRQKIVQTQGDEYGSLARCVTAMHASENGIKCGFFPSDGVWHTTDYKSMTPAQFKECMDKKADEVLHCYSCIGENVERFREAIAFVVKDYEAHYKMWSDYQLSKYYKEHPEL